MAKIQKFTYIIGYVGLTAQYHTIYVDKSVQIKPLNCSVSKDINKLVKLSAFYKEQMSKALRIPHKRSTNYEGVGKNFKR